MRLALVNVAPTVRGRLARYDGARQGVVRTIRTCRQEGGAPLGVVIMDVVDVVSGELP